MKIFPYRGVSNTLSVRYRVSSRMIRLALDFQRDSLVCRKIRSDAVNEFNCFYVL